MAWRPRRRVNVEKSMQTLEQIWKPGSEPQEGMTAEQLAVQIDALNKALGRLTIIKTNCHSCQRFSLDECALHGAVPQDFQRVQGACPDWRFDGVPF